MYWKSQHSVGVLGLCGQARCNKPNVTLLNGLSVIVNGLQNGPMWGGVLLCVDPDVHVLGSPVQSPPAGGRFRISVLCAHRASTPEPKSDSKHQPTRPPSHSQRTRNVYAELTGRIAVAGFSHRESHTQKSFVAHRTSLNNHVCHLVHRYVMPYPTQLFGAHG